MASAVGAGTEAGVVAPVADPAGMSRTPKLKCTKRVGDLIGFLVTLCGNQELKKYILPGSGINNAVLLAKVILFRSASGKLI